MVKAVCKGQVIAESDETVVIEGTVGLSGRYQRVVVPMGEDLFPGDLVSVRLRAEVSNNGDVSLSGEPLSVEVST